MPGDDVGQSNTESGLTTEYAFTIVGDEIRAEILQALGDMSVQERSFTEVSFSELRSRIDADIGDSQFNYHLQQLTGHFITNGDTGYRLRPEGLQLYRAIQAGVYDKQNERLETEAGFDCYYCQSPVTAWFDKGHVKITCEGCGYNFLFDIAMAVPPETFEDGAQAFAQYSKYHHHKSLGWARGICHICGNTVEPAFFHPEESPLGSSKWNKVKIELLCNHCTATAYLSVGIALLPDPGLMVFCAERGVDVTATPHWELEFAATDKHVTVHSNDPWEVALHVTLEGDTLELIVDDDLTVIERNRLDSSETVSASVLAGEQSVSRTVDSGENTDEVVLPDNATCVQALRHHQWPDGATCPHCDSEDTTKKGTTNKDAQRYRCHNCDSIFNDLTGTIFAGHRFSLPEMFYIIQEMKDTTTAQIARQLDRSYQSVLDFVHKVKAAHDESPDYDLARLGEPDDSCIPTGERE